MNTKLHNKRLSISLTISLLLHLLVLFLINIYLQYSPVISREKNVQPLEVRFAQLVPPKAQPKPPKKLLATTTPSSFKVAQAPVQKSPVIAPTPSAPVAEQATGTIQGIAIPGAVATPFPVQGRSSSSLFHPPPSQQNAAQIYYQRAMETQARQRTEYQARLILQQLQQLLAKELDVSPSVSGTCKLSEPDGKANTRLACDSSALYEVISKSEMNVVGMLVALRGMGNMINGFSAEHRSEKLSITLINENAQTGQNSTTQPVNKSQ